jgi:hypothetical protein
VRRNARRVDANQYLSRVCRVCGLTAMDIGKALSDRPALKPDWGKPTVRNFREEDGNGSYRAILLPEVQRRSVADLVSESLTRGNCPVDAVVISTSRKGDRPV